MDSIPSNLDLVESAIAKRDAEILELKRAIENERKDKFRLGAENDELKANFEKIRSYLLQPSTVPDRPYTIIATIDAICAEALGEKSWSKEE